MRVENGKLIQVFKSDIVNGTFDSWDNITSIEGDAFYGLDNLKEIDIPSHIEKIGERAFEDCYNLVNVTIDDGVNAIGEEAFLNCSALEYIRLPSTLKRIENSTFKGCYKLDNIKIPHDLRYIGKDAFQDCENLEKIFFGKSLKIIDDGAFNNCSNLRDAELPNTVVYIGKNAFRHCSNLISINLDENLKELGDGAFYGCVELKMIVIPSLIEDIKKSTFAYCISLENVILPSNLKVIDSSAFYSCEDLVELKIPNSVTIIGNKAFYGCNELQNIQLSKKLEKVGNEAFSNCFKLKKVVFPNTIKILGMNLFEKCRELESITLPPTVEEVRSDILFSCDKMKEVIIGEEKINLDDYNHIIVDNADISKFASGSNKYYIKKSIYVKTFLYAGKKNMDRCKIAFPEAFLDNLTNEQLKNIFEYDSLKHFKEIYKEYEMQIKEDTIDDAESFYTLAYCLGCFANEEIIVGGKSVSVAQKASVYLKSLLDKRILTVAMCEEKFQRLRVSKYNPDLVKFLTTDTANFEYLLSKEQDIVTVIENFDIIMHSTVRDGKGKLVKEPSIKMRIDNYLFKRVYGDVEEGNEDIVEEFMKFPSIEQRFFQKAQDIREKAKDAPHHIVGKSLKENSIIETIEILKKEINESSLDCKKILDELYEKEFTYEWLDKYDAKNFITGLYCDCCATIMSPYYGSEITEKSITKENMQNLIIKDKNGIMIAKATVYVDREKGYAVFNDIEMALRYGDESKENDFSDNRERIKIYKAFKRGVKAFVEEYNKVNKIPIEKVNIGWGFNKLKQMIRMFERQSSEVLPVPPFFKDAEKEQWVLYRKNNTGMSNER